MFVCILPYKQHKTKAMRGLLAANRRTHRSSLAYDLAAMALTDLHSKDPSELSHYTHAALYQSSLLLLLLL